VFPPVFDAQIYRSLHADISHLQDADLLHHFLTFGLNGGRIAGAVSSRQEFISLIPSGKKSLEIGPFNRPILTGENVFFADILSTQDLFMRAQEIGLDTSTIPEITWVLSDGTLRSVDQTFDCVLSSHNIEHQVDLVHHLNEVANLINSDGYYFLIIPDSRFCFDHFLRPSTIADVLDAHYSGRKKHTLKSVIEHRALTTHNDSTQHWDGNHGSATVDPMRVASAISEFEANSEHGIDVHAWQFTPESFERIVQPLFDLHLIPFGIERIYPTVRNDIEFFAILKKMPS